MCAEYTWFCAKGKCCPNDGICARDKQLIDSNCSSADRCAFGTIAEIMSPRVLQTLYNALNDDNHFVSLTSLFWLGELITLTTVTFPDLAPTFPSGLKAERDKFIGRIERLMKQNDENDEVQSEAQLLLNRYLSIQL